MKLQFLGNGVDQRMLSSDISWMLSQFGSLWKNIPTVLIYLALIANTVYSIAYDFSVNSASKKHESKSLFGSLNYLSSK